MNRREKLLLAVACLIIFCQSCTRDIIRVQPPVHFPIPLIEQTPFKSYLDSINTLGNSVQLLSAAIQINSPFFPRVAVPGQTIIGYSFRSSVAGKVISLGTLLPAAGFSHNVMLWDSITSQILAQADVPVVSSGKFTYVSLAVVNQSVDIQPNHPYVVTFNSLANGSALNTSSPGNSFYALYGIYHPQEGEAITPIIPFTQGAITFETYYNLPYDNILSFLSPTHIQGATNVTTVFGVCDIGFTPN